MLLLQGMPDVMRKFTCEGVFNPIELWIWQRIEGLGWAVDHIAQSLPRDPDVLPAFPQA